LIADALAITVVATINFMVSKACVYSLQVDMIVGRGFSSVDRN